MLRSCTRAQQTEFTAQTAYICNQHDSKERSTKLSPHGISLLKGLPVLTILPMGALQQRKVLVKVLPTLLGVSQ